MRQAWKKNSSSPCSTSSVEAVLAEFEGELDAGDFQAIEDSLLALAANEGSTSTVERMIVRLVQYIETEEGKRGQIARSERSALSVHANRCQIILDKTLLQLLGLGADRYDYIAERLDHML